MQRDTYARMQASKHTLERKKKKQEAQKKVYMEKGGNVSNLEAAVSRIGSEGGYYGLNAAQRAHRRPSVAGRTVLGVRAEGFCGCGAA